MDISGRKAWGCHGDRTEFHRHTHPPGRGELHTFYVPDWALFFSPIRVHMPFTRALSIVSACECKDVGGLEILGWMDFLALRVPLVLL